MARNKSIIAKEQSFAAAFAELESITAAFDGGTLDVDEGLKKFERGLALAEYLKKRLAEVGNKVEVIKKKFAAEKEVE